jgi:peptide-methionine (S)-S-oxide reductase
MEHMMNKNQVSQARRMPSLGKIALGLAATATVAFFLNQGIGIAHAESAVVLPAPSFDVPAAAKGTRATAVFAGGCFWGVQGVFQHTKGVLNAVSGYAGGQKNTADYDSVSGGDTGHAESVQVTYDPSQVSYGKLLQVFFSVAHDPTQLNHQFPDTGTQYRSAIFTTDAAQREVSERYIAQLDAAHVYAHKIVTTLAPLVAFYPAEGYHQDYLTRHPSDGYIARFDLPKLDNLKRVLPELYRATPVLVAQAGLTAGR